MYSTSKKLNSFSSVTHGTEKHFSECDTYVGLLVSHVYHINWANLINDSLLCPRGNAGYESL